MARTLGSKDKKPRHSASGFSVTHGRKSYDAARWLANYGKLTKRKKSERVDKKVIGEAAYLKQYRAKRKANNGY